MTTARILLATTIDKYYAFMESSERAAFSFAALKFNLTAAVDDVTDCVCVSLKYHMFGAGVGSLGAFAVAPSGSFDREWGRSGGLYICRTSVDMRSIALAVDGAS